MAEVLLWLALAVWVLLFVSACLLLVLALSPRK